MSMFELWLFFVALPALSGVMTVLTGLGGVATMIWTLFNAIAEERIAPHLGKCVAAVLACGLLAGAIPNAKQMAYLTGGYIATNTENVDKLPQNLVDAANKFLESYSEKEK